jgi:hypothetical protein
MPYRRLPNTDNARLKALLKAHHKGKETPPFKLAFSQSTLQEVGSFLPGFEKKILQQKSSLTKQSERSKDYQSLQRKARLYISHFIQVVNMAIQRGEISDTILEYYKLNGYAGKLPPLNTDEEIIHWGEKLIEGESERIQKGLSPITNPTMAVVKVRYEKFLEAFRNQKNLQLVNSRGLKELAELRPAADNIILKVWNEVEESFKDLPDELRREKAMEYGLVYVYRKNELNDQNLFSSPRMGIS